VNKKFLQRGLIKKRLTKVCLIICYLSKKEQSQKIRHKKGPQIDVEARKKI